MRDPEGQARRRVLIHGRDGQRFHLCQFRLKGCLFSGWHRVLFPSSGRGPCAWRSPPHACNPLLSGKQWEYTRASFPSDTVKGGDGPRLAHSADLEMGQVRGALRALHHHEQVLRRMAGEGHPWQGLCRKRRGCDRQLRCDAVPAHGALRSILPPRHSRKLLERKRGGQARIQEPIGPGIVLVTQGRVVLIDGPARLGHRPEGQQSAADAQDGRDAQHDQDSRPPPAGPGEDGQAQQEDTALDACEDGLSLGTAERANQRANAQVNQEHLPEVAGEDGGGQPNEEDRAGQASEEGDADGHAWSATLPLEEGVEPSLILNRRARRRGDRPVGDRLRWNRGIGDLFVSNVHHLLLLSWPPPDLGGCKPPGRMHHTRGAQ